MRDFHITEKLRDEFRSFAFLLGNSTLLPRNKGVNIEYDDFLLNNKEAIGTVFAIYANNRRKEMFDERINAVERAAEWLVHQCDLSYPIYPPTESWELLIEDGSGDVFEALKLFGSALGRNQLPHDIINKVDYLSALFEGGSFIEETVTIFANNIVVKGERVVNYEEASRRASQYIRAYMDTDYEVSPPFQEWELEAV